MKFIELTQGKKCIVDDDQYQFLNQWKWYVVTACGIFYAVRGDYSSGKHVRIHMERLIMNVEMHKRNINKTVDHINGNSLDNRKKNLRICSLVQNFYNQKKSKNNTSGFKGVQNWSKWRKNKIWHAVIRKNYKLIHLGSFEIQEEAALAYDRAAKELFGEYARLNFN